MELSQKEQYLRGFKIPELLKEVEEVERELVKLEEEGAIYVEANSAYVGKRDGDCEAFKVREAELFLNAPELNEAGRKTTVDEKKAWLVLQRREDAELARIAKAQREADFALECSRNAQSAAKRKLTRMHSLLGIREAQIRFLGSEI